MWAAVSILTGPLFGQPVRKEKEGGERYDGKPKQEGMWRELGLHTAAFSLGPSMGQSCGG